MTTDQRSAGRRSSDPREAAISPDRVRSFRYQLTAGEDVIDIETWAGSVPQVGGIAPRVRIGRSRWFNLFFMIFIIRAGIQILDFVDFRATG